MPKILRHSLFLPRIHSKVEKGNRSASFSFYFLFQIKSKYEMKKIYMYVLLTMHFLITKKIVSSILVRSMKLENKINAKLLHRPSCFISLHSMKLRFCTFWYILPMETKCTYTLCPYKTKCTVHFVLDFH